MSTYTYHIHSIRHLKGQFGILENVNMYNINKVMTQTYYLYFSD